LNHDGQIDIKSGSYNITVSNNYFTNHRTVGLMGSSIEDTGDVIMKVTYYRNWFDGTHSRHPRTRYGNAHVLNNLYTGIAGYGIGVTCGAQVLIEGNYFKDTPSPVLISQINDFTVLSGDPAGYAKTIHNSTINSGPMVQNLDGYDFDPLNYYQYTADDSQSVDSIVMANAGAGILNISDIRGSEHLARPPQWILHQNYPNPFNTMTAIEFIVAEISPVKLEVYDILGEKIETLLKGTRPAGRYTIRFDGSLLVSGVYFYRLISPGQVLTRKMILVR
jgi:hypothetical protein